VALRVEGRGLYKERLNVGLLASNLKQMFDQFSSLSRPIGLH
jgi:hypothetical protein